ncbi:MAG: hypothetical protein Q9179_002203 [Wetmoreana sp. 5 TL-2023]
MPLHLSAAHSSRVAKRSPKPPSLRRSASSPFTSFNQRKPIQRSKSKPESSDYDEDLFDERLDDLGIVTTLATRDTPRDVAQIIQYANAHMFEPVPERGGFNSVKIAEILNFRASLPKTVALVHVHALSKSPTATEREISNLTRMNILRKITIPGRGTGGSTIGEGLILLKDLEEMLDSSETVDINLKTKFLTYLRAHPLSSNISSTSFTPTEICSLKRAGFLTSTTPQSVSGTQIAIPSTTTTAPTSIPTISRAPSGSLAAIGGSGAVVEAGGFLGIRRGSSQSSTISTHGNREPDLQISLPNTGSYLRLLGSARAHLLSLIHKSRFREIPICLLRERWDGGIASDDPAGEAKKMRGEFVGVLPARTRKWKLFHGVAFEWVLAEAMGAGMLECFETGSVGRGVRLV